MKVTHWLWTAYVHLVGAFIKGKAAMLIGHDNGSSVYVGYEDGDSDINSRPWYSQLFLAVPSKVDLEVWVGSATILGCFFILEG